MSLLDKMRVGNDRAAAAQALAPEPPPRNTRASNGLKDFLWLTSDVRQGRLLDLGPVWQATVGFFTDRGFRVYTEDLLRAWREFLNAEEARLRAAPAGTAGATSGAALAERFLAENLKHPPETFHAILAWDVFDYLDAEMLPRMAHRLREILRPNGVVLAAFHASKPDAFHRYRVLDAQTIEVLAAPPLFPPQRVFQNREILNLFGQFRSSKTFVGRDQLREALFSK